VVWLSDTSFVIDANIVLSFLIKETGFTRQFLSEKALLLHSPEFLFEEIAAYRELMLKKGNFSNSQFEDLLQLLKSIVHIIPRLVYARSLSLARSFSPDIDDIAYFALVLHYNCPLWSNDKALKKQSVVSVLNTAEGVALSDLF
jgi:predicted nucleic acid-binding protein